MPAAEGKRLPASFSDVTTDATTFASNWRSTKNVMDAETSTEPIKVSGRRTQHPEMAEQSMQTGEAATAAPGAGFAHSQLLDAFLLEATPLLEDQLARNFEENKFAQYEVSWEEEHDQVTCAHAFKHEGKLAAHAPDAHRRRVERLARSSPRRTARSTAPTGRRAASRCCARGRWRRQLDPKRADVALPLADCLTCLAYHPEDPSVLAGGAATARCCCGISRRRRRRVMGQECHVGVLAPRARAAARVDEGAARRRRRPPRLHRGVRRRRRQGALLGAVGDGAARAGLPRRRPRGGQRRRRRGAAAG